MSQDEQETLDRILAQDMAQVTTSAWWQWLALGAITAACLCAIVALIVLLTRPDVQTVVKLVHVTSDGVAEDRGTVAMAQYTPADWQWISMLRQWVLDLRWQGLDLLQTQHAWERLKWHTCGEAVEQVQRYFALMEPFDHIGARKREVRDIIVTKGDMEGLWTVLWQEVLVQGAQQAETTRQSVSFSVARRKVTKEMERAQVNGFGLCVKKVGGLAL